MRHGICLRHATRHSKLSKNPSAAGEEKEAESLKISKLNGIFTGAASKLKIEFQPPRRARKCLTGMADTTT